MLVAYYGLGTDSGQLERLAIAKDKSYQEHLKQYNVIFLNVQQFLSQTNNIATNFIFIIDEWVCNLCAEFQMDYEEIKRMYDGYCFEGTIHITARILS